MPLSGPKELIGPDARSHVNRLCQAAKVPLIESGTAGYLGQVQPHINVRLKNTH